MLNKNADKLHSGFREIVSEHLEQVNKDELEPVYTSVVAAEQSGQFIETLEARNNFLRKMHTVWAFHLTCMTMISDVLRYMDKIITKDQKLPFVYDAGLILYRDVLLRSTERPAGQRMKVNILALIEIERNGSIVDRNLIKNCLNIMLNLSSHGGPEVPETVYATDFEEDLLQDTRRFYEVEAAQKIQDLNTNDYLEYADRRLREEDERVTQYLSSNTQTRLQQIVEHELLSTYTQRILETGLAPMLLNNNIADLANLHRLLLRVDPELKEFNAALTGQIVLAGDHINANIITEQSTSTIEKVNATALALRWVQDVLDLRSKYDDLLEQALQNSQDLRNVMTKAFAQFINRNPRSAEFVSLFIDDHLKKGLKGKTEQEVGIVLEKTVSLFRYINDKDVFERYYKNHLAKRLLTGRSVSDDAEKGMIAKLKVEVGSTFTSKMEGMFKDIKISTDILREFNKFENNQGHASSIDMSTNVLTSTFWPLGTTDTAAATCRYPREIEQRLEAFRKFYLNRHSGRQLTWLPTHGTADMRLNIGKKRYELNVSTYAMVILLQFQEVGKRESLSFPELLSRTSIPVAELSRNLQSLACAKYKILTKEPKSRDVKPSDNFYFNSDFTSPQIKIKIATIANKVETESERKDTYQRIEESRRHQTEACIVRTMKARKEMNYNNLVAEVTCQMMSKFNPDPSMIKSRIEALIERDYLERDENDRKVYRYLA